MNTSETQDTLTEINTALNRSMVLMEDTAKSSPKLQDKKSRKSITINTAAVKATSTPLQQQTTLRKSILKKTQREKNEETLNAANLSLLNDRPTGCIDEDRSIKLLDRPRNLEQFMNVQQLIPDPTKQTYTLQDLDPDDELWIFEVPKSVEPHDLEGKALHLGGKTKLKLGKEKYQVMSYNTSDCLTCVVGTGNEVKPFKIVNIRPLGTIRMRRKLSAAAKASSDYNDPVETTTVPFPKGLKPRDPVAGVAANGKIKKSKKRKLEPLD